MWLFLSLSLVLVTCSPGMKSGDSGSTARPGANAVETLVQESQTYSEALEQQSAIVINSREELVRTWESIHAGQTPVPDPPRVDFSTSSVVFASLGMKGSGGYAVSIDALEEIPEGMRVVITATSPGSTCMVTEALTTPVHLVRTRKLPAVILFDWRQRVSECE
jgi:hypothetical protein